MTGPCEDFGPNCYAWTCILGVCIPYLIWMAPAVYKEVSPIVPILNGFLFIATLTSLLLTSFTDPGIIPRWYILELNKEINDNTHLIKYDIE